MIGVMRHLSHQQLEGLNLVTVLNVTITLSGEMVPNSDCHDICCYHL